MNKILSMLAIMTSAAVLTGCDEYDHIYDEDCASVVRFDKFGEQIVKISPKKVVSHEVKLLRSGHDISRPMKAHVSVMTGEEWQKYAESYGMQSYNPIPAGCFTLGDAGDGESTAVDFKGNEKASVFTVNLDGGKIAAYEAQLLADNEIYADEDPVMCLPVRVVLADDGAVNNERKDMVINVMLGGFGGIETTADFMNFASAVNKGKRYDRWTNDAGEVELLADIDLSGVTDWTPIGSVSNDGYSTSTPFSSINPFKGVFDGKGHCIKGLKVKYDVTGRLVYGIFGAVENAIIRNVNIGDSNGSETWEFTGKAPDSSTFGTLAGFARNSTFTNCNNYVNINFNADKNNNKPVMIGGIVGTITNCTIGGATAADGCTNYGDIHTGHLSCLKSSQTSLLQGGIVGLTSFTDNNYLSYCVNRGHLSSPSGRTGGMVGSLSKGNLYRCDNYGTIEDDLVGQHKDLPKEVTFAYKRMGGMIGGTADLRGLPAFSVTECTNYGNVLSHLGCRAGGMVGHCQMQLIGCRNAGVILSDFHIEAGKPTYRHGPAWLAGWAGVTTDTFTNARGCVRGGRVGEYSQYKDNPDSAPEATDENAFCFNYKEYDPSINK